MDSTFSPTVLALGAVIGGGAIFGVLKWRARRRPRSTQPPHDLMIRDAASATKTVLDRHAAAIARAEAPRS